MELIRQNVSSGASCEVVECPFINNHLIVNRIKAKLFFKKNEQRISEAVQGIFKPKTHCYVLRNSTFPALHANKRAGP